ncbi:MAG: hypothetical protein ACOYL9_13795 [Ilumatobacteraceae bacterium]
MTETLDEELAPESTSAPIGSPPPDGPPPWVVTGLLAVLLPAALFLILRPERFGLTPNPLDPVFYTGYAINFDDIMNAVGGRHYFVSRWTSFYPVYLVSRVTDPYLGRLIVRWLIASAALLAIWRIRPTWNWAQRILIGVLVLSTPMFVRPMLTDYVEYTVVGVGLCVAAMCVRRDRLGPLSMFTIGVLSGIVVIANPFGVTIVAIPIAAALVLGWQGWRRIFLDGGLLIVGGLLPIVGGLYLFRWRYGLPDVYQPTIDFIRNFQAPVEDPWRSPTSAWIGHFTWIWVPPLLLISGLALLRRRGVRLERHEWAAIAVCGAQWLFQCFDEFVRKGYGLQLPFYWSYGFPAYAVGFVVIVGRLTEGMRSRTIAVLGAGWLALMLLGLPSALRLPADFWFVLVCVIVISGALLVDARAPAIALALVVGLGAVAQIDAPTYRPVSASFINASPLYDRLFLQAGNMSDDIHDETVWFTDEMDRIVNDASTSFLVLDNWSSVVTAVYGAHVAGHLLTINASGVGLSDQAAAEVRTGARPIVAVYGPPELVAASIATFPESVGAGTVILDVTNTGPGLGYRLVVYDMPDSAQLPFTWNGAALYRQGGEVEGDEVVLAADAPAGIVTFGPYVALPPGRYSATLSYRSSTSKGVEVGAFEVSSVQTGAVASTTLAGTRGSSAQAVLTFDTSAIDPSVKWEFRTLSSGRGGFVVESILLETAP